MRKLFFIFILVPVFNSYAQPEKVSFNVGFSLGMLHYSYDEIQQQGFYFSNQAWFDTIHSNSYSHSKSSYYGMTIVLNAGIQIPVYRREMFSVGLRPRVGFGSLGQLSPKAPDQTETAENMDPKRLNSRVLEAALYLYTRFGVNGKYDNTYFTLYGGYRFISSKENYSTPVIGASIGHERWAIGLYAHLFSMNYYRELSNGSKEVAKSFYEFGFTTEFFLFRKRSDE